MPDLLVEIGCEEVPAAHCRIAEAALPGLFAAELDRAGLPAERVGIHVAPRRLAVMAYGLPERREAERREVRGPRTDAPEEARQGFARKYRTNAEALEERDGFVWVVSEGAAAPAAELVPAAISAAVAGLQLPRTMRWPGGRFSRPIRWLVAKLDGEVLAAEVTGVSASGESRGPRPGRERVPIGSAATYLDDLRAHGVIVDAGERRATIVAGIDAAGGCDDPMGKLDEVVYLVERPRVLTGEFSAGYLDLPERIPVTAMQSHQRYFPIRSADGALEPRFLVVANGGDDDVVRRGNEEVLAGRLDDAEFAFARDRRHGLVGMVAELDRVSFLEGSGSLAAKAARLVPLVERLCEANDLGGDVRHAATRAAGLCKADLVSRLVGEFSALQGYAGSVYAAEAGEPADVCAAIEEHHRPDEAGGALPASPAGAVVALADKGDTIQVAFAAGLEPTGSRDPYGLRRAAAGLVAIALDRRWQVDLPALVGAGGVGFVLDRLEPVLLEEGVTIEEVRAARGSGETEPAEVAARARDLHEFAGPRRDAVRDAYGRCARIAGETAAGPLDERLLADAAERALADALAAGDGATLDAAADMAPAVERFFDEVLVMSDDEAVRQNRLTLVANVRDRLRRLGDFAQLPG
ncbi:MAG: glycine--tRNA ligase subunit beta [Gaiellales bacterium]